MTLLKDPANLRKHPERNKSMIRASLEEVGAGRSILVDGENIIRAGNGVFEQAQELGLKVRIIDASPDELIAVKRADLIGERAIRAAILDNRAGETSEWDAEALLALSKDQPDLVGDLFTGEELLIIAHAAGIDFGKVEPPEDPGAQIDKAEELRIKWGVESGQLWRLGEHRLICGDCTDRAVVDRAMGGGRAVCMWTDPPYGVNYVGKTKDALIIKNDGADGLPMLLAAAFALANDVLEPGAPWYVAHPAGALQVIFLNAVVLVGWNIHEQLIWVKDSMVLGHSDYHYRHEPILYGWTNGAGRSGRGNHDGSRWFGNHSQTTVFEIPRPKRSEEHPTMKPPELVEAHLINSSRDGDIVIDFFLGSGTTLIACERLGRKCRAIEISPAYVAVALERWATMTGKTPELIA